MAARGDQAGERRLERVGLQVVGGDVAVQVVDRHERESAGGGERLRGRDADEQRADQPRALRHGDLLDVVERGAGAVERVVDDRVDELEVVARGDLRDDAAEARVHALGGDDVGEQIALIGDDGGARVVARRLDREDHAGRRRARHVAAPHDHRVLAVVGVVPAAHAGRAEAELLVQHDRARVRLAHLERDLRIVADPLEQRGDQRGGDAAAPAVRVDGDVHHVPDRVVARADEVADQLALDLRGEADARRLGQLEHEHRERPRGRERAPLDRDDLREVGVDEAADLDGGGGGSTHGWRGLASGSRR